MGQSGVGAVPGHGPRLLEGAMGGSMDGTRVLLLPAPSSPNTHSNFLLLVPRRKKE